MSDFVELTKLATPKAAVAPSMEGAGSGFLCPTYECSGQLSFEPWRRQPAIAAHRSTATASRVRLVRLTIENDTL